MLTARGIPSVREGKEKNNHPFVSWYRESKDSNNLFTYIIIGTNRKKGICCKARYIFIYCTLCNLQVNIDIPDYIDDSDSVRGVVYKIHSHDDLQNKLIHILPSENGQFGEQFLGSAVNEGKFVSINDVRCGICDKRFSNRNTKLCRVASYIYDLNEHYRNGCIISKQCQARENLSFNRNEEIVAIYNAVKEYIDSTVAPIPRPKSPGFVDDFVKIVGKCNCGRNNILQCKVCKTEWKGPMPDMNHYISIIKRHFGKKSVSATFEDFIHSADTKPPAEQRKLDRMTAERFDNERQYRCVICGEDYGDTDNGALPPKEIVIDHFKQCLEANSHKFAAGGYTCAH